MEVIEFSEFIDLPYGENTNQLAAIAKTNDCIDYEILSEDKKLEYVDYLNMSCVLTILSEFFDVHTAVLAKENALCAVALGANSQDAFNKSLDCDPVSTFGATAGFSKEISLETAKTLCSIQIRNVIAPSFTKDALSYLLTNRINIVKINSPLQELLGGTTKDIKITPFGALIQEKNTSKLTKDHFKVVTKMKPNQQQAEDAIFAWKISKHLKNRSVVIAKNLSTKAIVQSKTNGIYATELALNIACEATKDAVLAIDGVIESKQIINSVIQARIGVVIESGDNVNSKEIVSLANNYELAMISTGLRNNKY